MRDLFGIPCGIPWTGSHLVSRKRPHVDVDVDTCTSRLSSKFLFGCKIHPSSRPQLREARRRMDGKTINKNTTTGGH